MSSPEMKSGIPANLLIIQIIRNLRGCFSVSCFSLFVWFIKLIFLQSKVEKSEEWWLTLWLTLQSERQVHNSVFGSPLSALCSQRPGKLWFFRALVFLLQNLCKETMKALYLREEVVDESAKGEPVRPAVCEVGDVHVLGYYALLSWFVLSWIYDTFLSPWKLTLLPHICILNWETWDQIWCKLWGHQIRDHYLPLISST